MRGEQQWFDPTTSRVEPPCPSADPEPSARRLSPFFFLAASLLGFSAPAQEKFIVMASTTSTEQSGLFAHLLPAFKQATGIDVRVVAVGTGQALDAARRGDADVVFVHDQAAEEKFVADGFGLQAPAGDVQRLRHRRPEVRSGRRSRQRRGRGPEEARRLRQRLVHLARRQERHACRRAALLEGGRRGPGRRQARRLQGMRLRHGPGPEHRGVERAPTCWPIAAPG